MHRTFISLITVAAMAVSGLTAAPAQASDKEAAQWIAGLAGLAIIGAAIIDHDKKKKKRRHQQQTHQYNNDYGHSFDGGHGHARPVPHYVKRKLLPGRCLVRGETRRGTVRGFGRHCLNRHYSYTNSLPENCAVRAMNRHGKFRRVIYRKKCLNRHGYQVAGRR